MIQRLTWRATTVLIASLLLAACDRAVTGPAPQDTPLFLQATTNLPYTDMTPGKLAVYYGWPSAVNDAGGSVDLASDVFDDYNDVVFGDGLQNRTHRDHANSKAIIERLVSGGSTTVYGYIPLGMTTKKLSMKEIRTRVDNWRAMGVSGIFLDEAGYDYGVTRARQNDAVSYVHSRGLKVFINAWNPDDVFGTQVNSTYNPNGTPPLLDSRDTYLLESYQIVEGGYQSTEAWVSRSDRAATYKGRYGTRMAALTTTAASATTPDGFEQSKLDYAWFSTRLYGFDLMGWGEPNFSASDSKLPARLRPTEEISGGGAIEHAYHDQNLHARVFTQGAIEVNSSLKQAMFTSVAP